MEHRWNSGQEGILKSKPFSNRFRPHAISLRGSPVARLSCTRAAQSMRQGPSDQNLQRLAGSVLPDELWLLGRPQRQLVRAALRRRAPFADGRRELRGHTWGRGLAWRAHAGGVGGCGPDGPRARARAHTHTMGGGRHAYPRAEGRQQGGGSRICMCHLYVCICAEARLMQTRMSVRQSAPERAATRPHGRAHRRGRRLDVLRSKPCTLFLKGSCGKSSGGLDCKRSFDLQIGH